MNLLSGRRWTSWSKKRGLLPWSTPRKVWGGCHISLLGIHWWHSRLLLSVNKSMLSRECGETLWDILVVQHAPIGNDSMPCGCPGHVEAILWLKRDDIWLVTWQLKSKFWASSEPHQAGLSDHSSPAIPGREYLMMMGLPVHKMKLNRFAEKETLAWTHPLNGCHSFSVWLWIYTVTRLWVSSFPRSWPGWVAIALPCVLLWLRSLHFFAVLTPVVFKNICIDWDAWESVWAGPGIVCRTS